MAYFELIFARFWGALFFITHHFLLSVEEIKISKKAIVIPSGLVIVPQVDFLFGWLCFRFYHRKQNGLIALHGLHVRSTYYTGKPQVKTDTKFNNQVPPGASPFLSMVKPLLIRS